MDKKNLLIAAVSVLVIAMIGITFLLVREKKANRELVEEFNLDKEDMENEYTRFVQQYDELKMVVTNDSLAQQLEQEQLKTQRLLEELRTVKSTNATEIRRLKKGRVSKWCAYGSLLSTFAPALLSTQNLYV